MSSALKFDDYLLSSSPPVNSMYYHLQGRLNFDWSRSLLYPNRSGVDCGDTERSLLYPSRSGVDCGETGRDRRDDGNDSSETTKSSDDRGRFELHRPGLHCVSSDVSYLTQSSSCARRNTNHSRDTTHELRLCSKNKNINNNNNNNNNETHNCREQTCETTASWHLSEDENHNTKRVPTSNKQRLRKVSFADDAGLPLTTVKLFVDDAQQQCEMEKCCNKAYKSSSQLKPICSYSSTLPLQTRQRTKVMSKQVDENASDKQYPAEHSAYRLVLGQRALENSMSYRTACLQTNCVVLDRALYSQRHNMLVGTVKVKNLVYDKTVCVRLTQDAWMTCRDISAKHVHVYRSDEAPHAVDFFQFDVHLSASTATEENIGCNRVQFAVRLEAGGQHYWDNNGGNNYIL